jgi:hypothetical protein
MGTTSAFRPTRAVSLRGDAVVIVRELDWSAAMEFLSLVASHGRDIIGPVADAGGDLGSIKRALFAQAPALVSRVRELGDYLIAHALEDPQALAGRGVGEVLQVLRVAIEINLSPAVLEAADALGKSVGAALLPSTTPTPTPPT